MTTISCRQPAWNLELVELPGSPVELLITAAAGAPGTRAGARPKTAFECYMSAEYPLHMVSRSAS